MFICIYHILHFYLPFLLLMRFGCFQFGAYLWTKLLGTSLLKKFCMASCAPNSHNSTKAAEVCPTRVLCTPWLPQPSLSPAFSLGWVLRLGVQAALRPEAETLWDGKEPRWDLAETDTLSIITQCLWYGCEIRKGLDRAAGFLCTGWGGRDGLQEGCISWEQ